MFLALTLLTGGALLTLVLGVVGGGDPVAVLPLGAAFALLATVGFPGCSAAASRAWSAAYVAVGLVLASVVFALGARGGRDAVLVVLVSQCVLLLPLPATVVVIAMVPMVHVGMPWPRAARGARHAGRGGVRRRRHRAAAPRAGDPPRARPRAHEQLRDYAGAGRAARHGAGAQPGRPRHPRRARPLADRRADAGPGRPRGARQRAGRATGADAVLAKAQQQSRRRWPRCAGRCARCARPRLVPPLPEALRALAEETSAAGVPTEARRGGHGAPAARPTPRRRCSAPRRRG